MKGNTMETIPKIGMTYKTPRLGLCVIVAVLPAGTIEVMTKAGKVYRISGLGFTI